MKKSTNILHRAVIETLECRRLLSLTAPVYSSAGAYPQAVATADLNDDGRSDVVTANTNSSNVSVLLSNASGALQPAQHFATSAVPHSVAVGDVSGDGKPDVVTTNDLNVGVLLGTGDGTLQTAQNFTLPRRFPPDYTGTESLPQTPQSVVVGDLNADGKLDLVVKGQTVFVVPYISPYGGTFYFPVYHEHVNVLIGNGGGSFAPANTYLLSDLAGSLVVGDFNGDNKADVVASGTQMGFLAGNGNGTLQPQINSGSSSWGRATVGDFDGDAKLDLVLSSGGALTFAKGVGNGTFAPTTVVYSNGTHVRSAVAGDVNADGKLDLVASAYRTTYESYGYSGGYGPTTREYTKVLLGFGNGTFSRAVSSTIRSYAERVTQQFDAVALGDFNADGLPDLVTADPVNNRVFVQLNQPGWIIPGTVSISDAPAVTEGHSGTTNAIFTVTLDQAPSPAATVTVDWEILDGTATAADGDFVDASGTITFSPGQTTKTITVQVKGDRLGEVDEDFIVRLTDSVNADITDDRGGGTIIDDEPRIASFTGGSIVEGNSGTSPLTFTVSLSAPSDAPVTLTYATPDSASTDYVPVTDTLTFAPGQTTRTFDVQVKGDLVPEYTENVYVNLIGATNALISNPNQAAGTITDNDPDPTISIANVSRAEGNSGWMSFEFVLTLSGRSEKVVSVQYATSGGSATSSGPNKDYNADSTFANIYPGQIAGSVIIYVNGDTRNESDETFFVNLSNATAASIADNQAVGTILDDESRGKTWVGPASGGNWSTASNWSPSGVPSANSLVSIDSASVTLSSSVTVAEISLIGNAVLTLAPNGNRVLRTSGLFLGYYPKLDLNDNTLIVDYTAAAGNVSPLGGWNRYNYTGIAGMIETGGGRENGWGIVTTRPDALNGVTTLGVAEASQVLGLSGSQTGLFSGQTVDATTVLIKYTHVGDANLDGMVSIADFITLSSNFNKSNATYADGDLNYDGQVTIADFIDLAANFNKTLAAPALASQPPAAESISTLGEDATDLVASSTAATGRKQRRSEMQPSPQHRMHHRRPRKFEML